MNTTRRKLFTDEILDNLLNAQKNMASAEKVDAKGLVLLSRFLLRILKKLGDETVELSTEEEKGGGYTANMRIEQGHRKGGEKMADNKRPCAPVEEEGRDTTRVFQETDPLCAALDELCAALNFWYGSMNNPWQREDHAYRKELAKRTQESLKRFLRAGAELDEGGENDDRAEKEEFPADPVLGAAGRVSQSGVV